MNQFWCYKICKHYQNIATAQVFTKVCDIHCNFSIVLPIRMKIGKFQDLFFLFYKGRCARPKDPAHLRGFAYWHLHTISQGLNYQLPRFLWRENIFIMHTPRQYFLLRWLLSNRIRLSLEDCFHGNNTHREKVTLTQFITRMAAWLLLIFFTCLYNQLGSIHSIITY